MVKNILATSIAAIISAGALVSCGGGGENNGLIETLPSNTAAQRTIFGVVQKGPATSGGLIIAHELNPRMERTGRQFKTHTTGKQGVYSFKVPNSWQNIVEVVFTGSFFDEATGKASSEIVTLSATALLETYTQVSVNIPTSMVAARARTLINKNNWSFEKALDASSSSVAEMTGISKQQISTLDMRWPVSPKDEALALFISGSIVELAKKYNQPTQRVIDQIVTNFAIDGQFSGIAATWEARLKELTLGSEDSYTNEYSSNLSAYSNPSYKFPDGINLPEIIPITTRPVAVAVGNLVVEPGATVTLDGSQSYDVDSDVVNATWFQTDHGEFRAVLDDRFSLVPKFTAPNVPNTTLIFALVIDDDLSLEDSQNTEVTNRTDNRGVTDTTIVKVTVGQFSPSFENLPPPVDEDGIVYTDSDDQPLVNTVVVKEGGEVEFTVDINNPFGEANPLQDDLTYSFDFPSSVEGLVFPETGGGASETVTVKIRHKGDEGAGDTLTITVKDEEGNESTIRVNLIFIPVNDDPDAEKDYFRFTAGNELKGDVLAKNSGTLSGQDGAIDSDIEGDDLTVCVSSIPPENGCADLTNGSFPLEFGTIKLESDGKFTYTLTSNITSEVKETFTYLLKDDKGGKDTATVEITIPPRPSSTPSFTPTPTPVNQRPVALPDTITTPVNTEVTFALTGTDADTTDSLTYTITYPNTSEEAYGPLSSTSGNLSSVTPVTAPTTHTASVTYTPKTDYVGTHSFTFTVNDGSAPSEPTEVFVTVAPVANQPPVAEPPSVYTTQDQPIGIPIGGYDPDDGPNSPLEFEVNTDLDTICTDAGPGPFGPFNGMLSHSDGELVGSNSVLGYTPNTGFTGVDNITYCVSDGEATSASVNVPITVYATLTGKTPTPYSACDNYTGDYYDYDAGLGTINVPIPVGDLAVRSDGSIDGLEILSCTATDGNGDISIEQTQVVYTNTPPFFPEDEEDVGSRDLPSALGETVTPPTATVTFSCTIKDTLRDLEYQELPNAAPDEATAEVTIDYGDLNNFPDGCAAQG